MKAGRRALFFFPWLNVGGADKFNLDLLGQLGARGWESRIVTSLPSSHPWEPEFARHCTDILLLDRRAAPGDAPRMIADSLRAHPPDVLFLSNSELAYRLLPYLRHLAPQAAIVDLCHSADPRWIEGGYARLSVDNDRLLDLSIVTSEHLKDWMTSRGKASERIAVCYTCVDVDRWKPDPHVRDKVRAELRIDDRTALVLYAARIDDEKEPLLAVRAIEHVASRGHDVVCLVAGDGPLESQVRNYVKANGLERTVRLMGAVSLDRIRELMIASDIFFLPSRFEGIALTLYEAMATETCVLASDVGGQRELVPDECGVLLGPHGVEALEAYSQTLERLARSPSLRAAMTQRSRRRVESSFRLEQMGERVAGLLETAIGQRQAVPMSPGEVRTAVAKGVRHLRFEWGADAGAPLGDRVYILLSRLGHPFYRWGIRRHWRWIAPAREAIRRRIIR